MGLTRQIVLFLATVLAFGLASSFRISHRSEPSTDLVKGLAMLQRQRRRVSAQDFMNSERLAARRPMTLEDVSLWLGDSDVNDDWQPETGSYENFDPSDEDFDTILPAAMPPTRIKASANEVNDIFAKDDDDDQEDDTNRGPSGETFNESPEKKKKEELVELHGDKQTGTKQVSLVSPKDDMSSPLSSGGGLDSLTEEEVRVLMKAAGKLKQRAADITRRKKSVNPSISESYEISDVSDDNDDDNADDKLRIQPDDSDIRKIFEVADDKPSEGMSGDDVGEEASEEEEEEEEEEDEEKQRQQLVDEVAAIEAAETEQQEAEAEEEKEEEEEEESSMEQAPTSRMNGVAEQIVSMQKRDLSPELITKYLLMNRDKLQLPINSQNGVEAEKRSSDDLTQDGVAGGEDDTLDVSDLDGAPPLIQAFVAKILALQNEIDGLRFMNRLEDLENDELTDALNEATIGQREGSVSDEEWKSLQHAIEIEEALQDLKKKQTASSEEGDDVREETFDDRADMKRKRGEPWKRGREANDLEDYAGSIASRSTIPDQEISKEDIERLLGSAYLMKEAEERAREMEEEEEEQAEEEMESRGEEEEDEPVASLFLSHAERCPAIQRYSNNCELADLYNLPVDFEARALCNLHEMCYACGHSLSVSQPQCDLVYRAAVSSLCHGKDVCIEESEVFLRTMKLKTRYIPHVQASCRSRCTAQFMGMF